MKKNTGFSNKLSHFSGKIPSFFTDPSFFQSGPLFSFIPGQRKKLGKKEIH
jgi:hypothetical protein